MTALCNDPRAFAAEMLEGFLDANAQYVVGVEGGVIRAEASPAGKVAVVIGGGSGHYPSFAGFVGRGFADAAVVGDVFASPSGEQVVRVVRAADHGGGVLLAFGNYTGDALNFGIAADRLRAEGVAIRVLAVTDDVASAPAPSREQRRGIAGGVVVYKIAGAAAEAGFSLAEVARVAELANASTRSLGVAFAGCTLPGSDKPLFHVPAGRMAVGMGIHGEPGVSESGIPTADELAMTLVDGLFAERPTGAGSRVAVILNGLGSTKHEELFVLWRGVANCLRKLGVEIVEPEVGELTTSLDMAGCSLTLCWLDGELEALWRAPAEAPAFRKGIAHHYERIQPHPQLQTPPPRAFESTRAGRRAAQQAIHALTAIAATMQRHEAKLGALDAVAGDGDHGAGMLRGASAAVDAAQRAGRANAGLASVLAAAGDAWGDKGGGTSGALWGVALSACSQELTNLTSPTSEDVVRGVQAALRAIQKLGGAGPGDKTMVDALVPFAQVLAQGCEAGEPLVTAWAAAAQACATAAVATAELIPTKGRARPLAARSVGSPDPGATSLALCLDAAAPFVDCGRTHD